MKNISTLVSSTLSAELWTIISIAGAGLLLTTDQNLTFLFINMLRGYWVMFLGELSISWFVDQFVASVGKNFRLNSTMVTCYTANCDSSCICLLQICVSASVYYYSSVSDWSNAENSTPCEHSHEYPGVIHPVNNHNGPLMSCLTSTTPKFKCI